MVWTRGRRFRAGGFCNFHYGDVLQRDAGIALVGKDPLAVLKQAEHDRTFRELIYPVNRGLNPIANLNRRTLIFVVRGTT